MKKTLIPLSILAIITLAGCGGTSSSTPSTSSATPAESSQTSGAASETSKPSASSSEAAPTSSETAPTSSEAAPVSSEAESESSEAAPVSSEAESESSEATPVSSEDPVTYGVEITNKDVLTSEWKYGDSSRNVSISVTPAGNITALINSGELVVTTSDPSVVDVEGRVLVAKGKGTATITVTYHDASDSVDVTVDDVEFMGIDEIIALPADQTVNFKGVITCDYGGSGIFVGNGDYGILMYQTTLSSTGAKVGDSVRVIGAKTSPYGGLPELKGGSVEVIQGTDASITAPTTITVNSTNTPTFTGTTANRPLELSDGVVKSIAEDTYKDAPRIQGIITVGEVDYPIHIDGRYVSEAALASWYRVRDGKTDPELIKAGDFVSLSGMSYVNSNKGQIVNATVTGWTEGEEQEEAKEPSYHFDKTLADLVADGVENGKEAYAIRVKVANLGNTAGTDGSAGVYGNMYVCDENGENTIQVYGSTASISALTFNPGSVKYNFSNPQNFQTNEATAAIKKGDILDVIAIRADYGTTKEINCIIRGVNGKPISNMTQTTAEVLTTEATANFQESFVTVTGKITRWYQENNDATKYGNFYIKTEGSEGETLVYGATATDTALTIASNKANFTNPKDFLTNDATKNLAIGDEVTMLAVRSVYNGTVQLKGLVIPKPVVVPDVVEIVHSGDSVENAFTIDEAISVIKGWQATETKVGETEVYVTGVVDTVSYNANHSSYTFNLKGDVLKDGFQFYSCSIASEIDDNFAAEPERLKGATLTIHGYLEAYVKNNVTTYEVGYLGDKISPTGSAYTPQIVAISNAAEPTPIANYYLTGGFNNWNTADTNYLFTKSNQQKDGKDMYVLNKVHFDVENGDVGIKVVGQLADTTTWYPDGMGNDFIITVTGDYNISFVPEGGIEGWYEGFFKVELIPDTPVSEGKVDTLNHEFAGVSGTAYKDWNKTAASGVAYAGNSGGGETGKENLQLRSSKNNSGIVVTGNSAALKVAKIVVTWDTKNTNSDLRKLDIYGSETAYSAPADLYGNAAGDKLGSVAFADRDTASNACEFNVTGNYSFIGIRSSDGACYIESIVITWVE